MELDVVQDAFLCHSPTYCNYTPIAQYSGDALVWGGTGDGRHPSGSTYHAPIGSLFLNPPPSAPWRIFTFSSSARLNSEEWVSSTCPGHWWQQLSPGSSISRRNEPFPPCHYFNIFCWFGSNSRVNLCLFSEYLWASWQFLILKEIDYWYQLFFNKKL